jgi:hypothetical protein
MQVITPVPSTGSATGLSGLGANGTGVLGAIQGASRATGASFDYLLTTARVESNFNPTAAAKTSSAKGLFQFIDQTWLATMKQSGGALGYGRYADAITRNADGNYTVANPGMRHQILALRNDAKANAAMAGAFTNANANALSEKIGRKPTDGELYIAHFMGVNGAAKLINAANDAPNQTAASLFPRAARANKSIFYEKSGGARSASEVYDNIIARYDAARSANATAVAALQAAQGAQTVAAVTPVSTTAATPAINLAPRAVSSVQAVSSGGAQPAGPLFHNMFAGEARQGVPVSRVISHLWSSNPRVAAALMSQPAASVPAAPSAVQAVGGASADTSLGGLYRNQSPNVSAMFGAG